MQQQQYPAPQVAVPSSTQLLAANHQLGTPIVSYRFNRLLYFLLGNAIIAGFIVTFIVIFLFGYFLQNAGYAWLILFLLFCTPSLFTLRNPQRLTVYTGGIVYLNKERQYEVCRWEDISTVYSNRYQSTDLRLVLMNGKTITVSSGFVAQMRKGVDLLALVENTFVLRYINDAMRLYWSGQWVNFGPVSLSQQGFYMNQEVVPWSEIKTISVEDTGGEDSTTISFVIYKRNGGFFPRKVVAITNFPNFCLCLEMLTHYLNVPVKISA